MEENTLPYYSAVGRRKRAIARVKLVLGKGKMEKPKTAAERPLISASMFGNTTKCVDHARGILEAAGYEVLVFHATGTVHPPIQSAFWSVNVVVASTFTLGST